MNTVEHDARRRRFTLEREGHQGVLDYSLTGAAMIITHTGVPAAIEGRGVAGRAGPAP
jgi:uncharacterized protein